jgi:arabinogalactan endo-1,4-beta-galactosidase
MLVETDWPNSCTHPEYPFPSDTKDIPFSAAGQTTWMQTVAKIVEEVGGTGLYYWEPGFLYDPPLGSSCESNLMVNKCGKALSSLDVFNAI